ncbi:hypothetical protein SCORR_v1c02530 [Spiroplasma corruscae]|uniref:Uncharacterized protein n=1 Tax=Spiroplasma corruscae TaxID=216934 RepID=A0A222ENG8_9MOLU|nr:hypothetical protein [Spiroplasma corruscae]ASP28027.1 hypothetical protein SCORR_v1c02530 [Spiroplasma corruscae]
MIINIGPWWLFDILSFAIIISSTIYGIKKGFLVLFYFLFLQVLIIVLLLFIPALITNALVPSIMNGVNKWDPSSWFESVSKEIVNLINSLLPNSGGNSKENIGINGKNVSYELAKTIIALVVYIVISIVIFIIVNLVGFLTYLGFRKRIKNVKVFGRADSFLGAIHGLFLGFTISMGISFIASFPLISTENQSLGALSFNDMTNEEIQEYINGDTAYSKYSLSKKLNMGIPNIPSYSFTYTNVCSMKYVVKPTTIISTQVLSNNSTSSISDFYYNYEDILAEGYSSNNVLDVPVSYCIETMPKDSKTLFRLISEIMLMGSKLYVKGNEVEKSPLFSIDLINALDEFYYDQLEPNNYETKVHDGWLNENQMINFYEWSEKKANGNVTYLEQLNPFIKLSNYINDNWRRNSSNQERKLVSVFKDPSLTYNFFRNLYYVNSITRNDLDTLPTLSSTLTSLYFFNGMEISPSGELKLGRFKSKPETETENESSEPTIADIVHNDDNFWETYNRRGNIWLKYYFSFMYEGEWGYNE